MRNIIVVFRLFQTEMTQTLTCSGNAENKARQEQNSAEDVRDVTKKDPDGGSVANERQRRHRQPPRRRVGERDTCAAPTTAPRQHNPPEALRPRNERKSAHAAVARRAGGPRVGEARCQRRTGILFSLPIILRTAMTDKFDSELV